MPETNAMQPIEVTARFDADGKVTPLRFRWRGSLYTVVSTGRRWQAEDGWHTLVMTNGERMFDLCFCGTDCRWYLARTGASKPGQGRLAV